MTPDELWEQVMSTFIASDHWCHTHHNWEMAGNPCDDGCETVSVFMAAPSQSRPTIIDDLV